MTTQRHGKIQEEAYRRAYHQAVAAATRFLEAGIEQHVDPRQILTYFQEWEQKMAVWRGALETGRLLDPPPAPGESHLRLVEREEDGLEDERVDPRLREIIAHVRDIPRGHVRLRSTFDELHMTGVPNLMYLAEALSAISKAFGIEFDSGALERFSSGSVGELQAYLEGEE